MAESSRAKRTPQPPDALHEVVVGKLYTVSTKNLKANHFSDVTTVIDMSGEKGTVVGPEKYLCLTWATSDNVDEGQFEGVIRFCSSVMKSKGQRVLVIGHQDTVDTVATCVLREFVGCDAQTSLDVMRSHSKNCMTKSELVETVLRYRPS